MKKQTIAVLGLALSLMMGCQQIAERQIHFIQGNQLNPDQIKRIHVGQSQQEVMQILGSPVYDYSFDNDRLVYVTHVREGLNEKTQRIILRFSNNRLVEIGH